MHRDEDLIALAEAVLDADDPTPAQLIREIRNEWGYGLREAADYAAFALRTLAARQHKCAHELLRRMPK